jgi:very-short-patch-repair endonuclease
MRRPKTPIQRAEKLASQQQAAISRRQALQAGLTPRQIDNLRRQGRWHRAARNVYVIAGSADTWERKAAVAWLAGPPGTVISHLTAAALHGFARAPAVPHVTVPYGRSGRIPNAVVHTARQPAGQVDQRWIGGLRCTGVARTISDCAATLTAVALADMVDEAVCQRLTRPAAILTASRRAGQGPGRKGDRLLVEALAIWTPGPVAESAAEMRLNRRIQQLGYPPLERQVKIRNAAGKVVARGDTGISAYKILFEYDGKKAHNPRYWAKDDQRDAAVEAAGGRVLRYNRHDLLPSSTRLRDELTALLPTFHQTG